MANQPVKLIIDWDGFKLNVNGNAPPHISIAMMEMAKTVILRQMLQEVPRVNIPQIHRVGPES